MLIKR